MKTNHDKARFGRRLRSAFLGAITISAVLALCITEASANRGRGGRGGGSMAQSSVSGANRATSQPRTGSVSAGNRANTGNVNSGNRANTGNVNSGNRVNTGNVNAGNNVNTGNVNIGNDVNIDIDRGYGGGYYHRPIAAGVAIGAMAVTTAAVIGRITTRCRRAAPWWSRAASRITTAAAPITSRPGRVTMSSTSWSSRDRPRLQPLRTVSRACELQRDPGGMHQA